MLKAIIGHFYDDAKSKGKDKIYFIVLNKQ